MEATNRAGTIRTVDLVTAAPEPRGKTCFCASRGCHAPTSMGKPYCQEHLGAMPYVQKIERELAALERSGVKNARRRARRFLEVPAADLRAAS